MSDRPILQEYPPYGNVNNCAAMLDAEQGESLWDDAVVSHSHQGEVQLQKQKAVQLHVFKRL